MLTFGRLPNHLLPGISGPHAAGGVLRQTIPVFVNAVVADHVQATSAISKENSIWFGTKGKSNYNHAEQKLMNYFSKRYAKKNARIIIAVENTSASQPGRCEGCESASNKFENYHTNFEIEFYEGSTGDNP